MSKPKMKPGKGSRRRKYVNIPKLKIRLNRKHKDSVFCMLFDEKRKLLSLYNAINGSDFADPDDLEITTIGAAISL